jgi:hypothetical protein
MLERQANLSRVVNVRAQPNLWHNGQRRALREHAQVQDCGCHCTATRRPLAACAVRHLGDAYSYAGWVAQAEPCYVEALSIYRREHQAHPLDVANAVRAFAVLKQQVAPSTGTSSLGRGTRFVRNRESACGCSGKCCEARRSWDVTWALGPQASRVEAVRYLTLSKSRRRAIPHAIGSAWLRRH